MESVAESTWAAGLTCSRAWSCNTLLRGQSYLQGNMSGTSIQEQLEAPCLKDFKQPVMFKQLHTCVTVVDFLGPEVAKRRLEALQGKRAAPTPAPSCATDASLEASTAPPTPSLTPVKVEKMQPAETLTKDLEEIPGPPASTTSEPAPSLDAGACPEDRIEVC